MIEKGKNIIIVEDENIIAIDLKRTLIFDDYQLEVYAQNAPALAVNL